MKDIRECLLDADERACLRQSALRLLHCNIAGEWPPEHADALALSMARSVVMLDRHIEALMEIGDEKKPA